MQIPQIQIQQYPARLHLDADPGRQELQQPRADLEMRQVRPRQRIEQPQGTLEISQDRAWDALALGNHLEMALRMYARASELALQGLARKVEEGNRLAAIHLPGNPIAELARNWQRTFPEMDFRGPASVDNVDIRYTAARPRIQTEPGRIDTTLQLNKPIHHYMRGKLDIYMEQYPRVDITPPAIDLLV